jgi:hypothetical protein
LQDIFIPLFIKSKTPLHFVKKEQFFFSFIHEVILNMSMGRRNFLVGWNPGGSREEEFCSGAIEGDVAKGRGGRGIRGEGKGP